MVKFYCIIWWIVFGWEFLNFCMICLNVFKILNKLIDFNLVFIKVLVVMCLSFWEVLFWWFCKDWLFFSCCIFFKIFLYCLYFKSFCISFFWGLILFFFLFNGFFGNKSLVLIWYKVVVIKINLFVRLIFIDFICWIYVKKLFVIFEMGILWILSLFFLMKKRRRLKGFLNWGSLMV